MDYINMDLHNIVLEFKVQGATPILKLRGANQQQKPSSQSPKFWFTNRNYFHHPVNIRKGHWGKASQLGSAISTTKAMKEYKNIGLTHFMAGGHIESKRVLPSRSK